MQNEYGTCDDKKDDASQPPSAAEPTAQSCEALVHSSTVRHNVDPARLNQLADDLDDYRPAH